MANCPITDPYLDAGMRGFIVNTARKEYWRVAEWYALEDLIQDGYLCYAKCHARYVGRVTEGHRFLPAQNPDRDSIRHMMGLVRTAYCNYIVDLAKKHMKVPTRAVSQMVGDVGGEAAVWDKLLPSAPEASTLWTLVLSAPAELKELITILASDGAQALNFERRGRGKLSARETTNEFYCRLLRLDPKQRDIVTELRSYFGEYAPL